MTEETIYLLKEFNRLEKELDDLYHGVAVKANISDSAFTILYSICELGDGCLQRDICRETFANKQTVNSSIRKLTQDGYLYLEQGRGRDKHIFLTESGRTFVEEHISPIIQKEEAAFADLEAKEQAELLKLSKKYVNSLKLRMKEENLRDF